MDEKGVFMSRAHKTGLDYFSFDVDFFNDEKIEFVSAKYGNIGELIVVKLLCRIYRNGYFLKWGEDECLLFAKRAGDGISQERVDEVINELLERDFFCKKTFKNYQVLTSNGIQKRFLEATKRRKSVDVTKEYLIADIDGFDVNVIKLNVNINSQRKVKESKGKESKEIECWILPEGIKSEIWQEYEDHRKTTKTKLTDAARTKNANVLLGNLSDQQEIVDNTIRNGWTGLFSLKKKNGNGGKPNGSYTGLNEKDYSEGIGADGSF